MCSPLEQAGKERERVKEREKGEPYTRIPDSLLLLALLLLVLSSSTVSSFSSPTTLALKASLSSLLLLLEGDIVWTTLYSADLVCILDFLGTVFALPSEGHGSSNASQLEFGHLLALADGLSQEVHVRGELSKKDHDLEVFFDFYLLLCQFGKEGNQVVDDWCWVFVGGNGEFEGFFEVEVNGDDAWFSVFLLQYVPKG